MTMLDALDLPTLLASAEADRKTATERLWAAQADVARAGLLHAVLAASAAGVSVVCIEPGDTDSQAMTTVDLLDTDGESLWDAARFGDPLPDSMEDAIRDAVLDLPADCTADWTTIPGVTWAESEDRTGALGDPAQDVRIDVPMALAALLED